MYKKKICTIWRRGSRFLGFQEGCFGGSERIWRRHNIESSLHFCSFTLNKSTDCYGKSFKAFVLSSRNIDTLSAISLDWTVVGSETSGSWNTAVVWYHRCVQTDRPFEQMNYIRICPSINKYYKLFSLVLCPSAWVFLRLKLHGARDKRIMPYRNVEVTRISKGLTYSVLFAYSTFWHSYLQ